MRIVGTRLCAWLWLPWMSVACTSSGLMAMDVHHAEPGEVEPPVAPAPAQPEVPDVQEPSDPPPADPPEQPNDDPAAPPPADPVEPPEDPPPPPQDPVDPPDDDPPAGPPSSAPSTDACYPGSNGAWSTCLATVSGAGLGPDYDYPSPISAQYAEPERYLDLQAIPGSTMLAPNFRLDEIAQLYKGRYAVVQPHAIERLQDLRDDLGALVINSGYRPPAYNASIGGASSSRHMYGDGFDIDPVSVSLTALQDACYAHGAGYVGVYTTHMHCDWRSDPLDAPFYGGSGSSAFSFAPPAFDAVIDRTALAPLQVGGRAATRLSAPAIGWDEGEPLREWTAFDADGYAIDVATGDTYEPPADATSVEVWIGRELVRVIEL